MKQSEITATAVGEGAITIQELSNGNKGNKIPRITIIQPVVVEVINRGYPDQAVVTHPASSLQLEGVLVAQIYAALHEYFQAPHSTPHNLP